MSARRKITYTSGMETVAVIFGGRSAEHDVSIITALTSIIKPLELSKKYHVVAVYIAKDGRWFVGDKLKDVALYQGDGIAQFMTQTRPAGVLFDEGMKLLVPTKVGRKEVFVDIVFPAMHGTYGEDGALMGMLDMAGVAYAGCDMQASVVAMDKVLAKAVAKNAGLLTVPDVIFSAAEYFADAKSIIARIERELKYPAFVKPPHLGSSIGVMKVNDRRELENAIEVALHYDSTVLVEMAVPNLREATLPIIGYGDEIIPALMEEPLFSGDEFFDFDIKYLQHGKGGKGGAKTGAKQGAQGYSRIPADFTKKLYDQAEAVALAGFKAASCSGIARVDILINEKTGDVYFNEINPLPGSLYAHNWIQAGISKIELVEKLVGYAKARQADRKKLATSFDTNFLQQF